MSGNDGSYIKTSYDNVDKSTQLHYKFNGQRRDVYFSYSPKDNLPLEVKFGEGSAYQVKNNYDTLTRLSQKAYAVTGEGAEDVKANYGYIDWAIEANRTTGTVRGIYYSYSRNSDTDLSIYDRYYVYDESGNIATESVWRSGSTPNDPREKYTYDSKNQLTRHDSVTQNKSFTYEYDAAGNILSKKEYAYTTGTLGAATKTINYGYDDASWGDLLTAYNGQSIEYDEIGNPTSYLGWTMSWQGRQLASATKDGKSLSYTYNSDGIRTGKTVNGVKTEYLLNGTQVLAQKTGNDVMWFFYDQQGNRVGMADSSNHIYYYLYNLQGDVIALADAETGKLAATYTYDAWGKIVSVKNASGYTIGTANPFRYRGYYYDTETGFYYLNSRYYNPEVGRFLNADAFVSTDITDALSANMFAYCENNPVNRADALGCCWYGSDGKWHHDNWEYLYGYERKPEPAKNIGTTSSGKNVYVGSNDNYAASSNSIKVIDARDQSDPNMKIIESFRIDEENEMIEISSILLAYNNENPSIPSWNRTLKSMVIEWDIHNRIYDMGLARDSTADVDLNNNDEGKEWGDFIWERGIKPLLPF